MSIKKRLVITLKFSSNDLCYKFWESQLKKEYEKNASVTYYTKPKSYGLHTVTIKFNNKTELLSTDELGKMRKACKAKFIDQKIGS